MPPDTLQRILEEHGRILVISHIDPDGDAVGSVLGLYHFLRKLGKQVDAVLKDPVPQYLDFLPGLEDIQREPRPPYGLTIVVDASGFDRTGFDDMEGLGDLVRIDHHITGHHYGPWDYLDPKAPSCGLLVYRLIRQSHREALTPEIATCLYTALLTDTGAFKYLNRDPEVFEAARDLTDLGANPGKIARLVFQRRRLEAVRLQARALQSLRLAFDGRVGYVVVHEEDLRAVQAEPTDTEGLANLVLSIRGVAVGIMFLQDQDHWKISFRGKGVVDLALIAEAFGGGGHKNASGCRVPGPESQVVAAVLQAVGQALNGLDLSNFSL